MNNIKKIMMEDIKPFKNHPFKVERNEELVELAESIRTNGLINPIIVRPIDNNKYELISGHRRLEAMKLNGEIEINADIRNLSDEEATIYMVDSNMHREKILPSEKAFAYKMKLEAQKKLGVPVGHSRSREALASYSSDSSTQIQRYIRLTYLIPELLKIVDDTYQKNDTHHLTMGIRPAVELSYLNKDQQKLVYNEIIYEDLTPSHGQAIKIRKLAEKKKLDIESLEDVMYQDKGNQHDKISFNKDKIESHIPRDILSRDKRYIEEYIIKALESYSKELEGGDAYDLDI